VWLQSKECAQEKKISGKKRGCGEKVGNSGEKVKNSGEKKMHHGSMMVVDSEL
jgi:hypothetical protein